MPIFEDQTPEVIRNRILSRMETDLQTREGSYSFDLVSPVAFELWRVLMTLDELIDAFYVNEYSGPYLDKTADLLGMARREGTKAAATMSFTGRSGVVIPAGTAFFTAGGLEFDLVYNVTLKDGTGTGYVRAAQVGDEYNVDAGEINQILRNISGLETYANEAAQGGTDPESDADLFDRIDSRRKNPATSGNENHYREWALECDGVGACKVTRLWNGPGTVRVLLAGYDRHAVDETVVNSVAEHIETVRPVGADVTVLSAGETSISVSAQVVLTDGAALAGVQAAFVVQLDAYLQELANEYFRDSQVYDYTVHYNKIASLLMDIDGVVDFTALTVNGGVANVVIGGTAVPVCGEVELTCTS